jgi:ADP-ribosylglycohydrolase
MWKPSNTLLGAIAGDVIGSVYEYAHIVKTIRFPLFTPLSNFSDDSVLTMAVADSLISGRDFAGNIWDFAHRYPNRGYGGSFKEWLKSDEKQPYGSYGNGSAMRVSPVGLLFDTMDETLKLAEATAAVTHNHPEGIKGAKAIAAAIYLARTYAKKTDIEEFISFSFGYDLGFSIEEIRPSYKFDVTCQGSVPQAIVAFLDSRDYEHAIRLAVSLGGDSDTIACMAGGIAAAFYKDIPLKIMEKVTAKLPYEFLQILNAFDKKFAENI